MVSVLLQKIRQTLFGLPPDRAVLKPIRWLCQVPTKKASSSDAFFALYLKMIVAKG